MNTGKGLFCEDNDMDAFEAIEKRYSVRKYSSTPVAAELIDRIVDAGRRAPTARNVQPWEFIVISSADTRSSLAAICDYGKFLAEAPVCIATFCKETKYYIEDGCAAIENMLIAATALGLGTCWVAGDKKDYAPVICEKLGVPAGYRLVGLIALGVAAAPGRPTEKRPLAKVIHYEKW